MPKSARPAAAIIVAATALVVAVVLSTVVGGCSSSNSNRTPPKFRDVPIDQAGWTQGRRLWSSDDGRTLNVAIDRDPQGLYVNRIDYEVYDGSLYLSTVRQSRPFSPSRFEIDMAGMRNLKQPWQDHVYWVADVRWESPTRRVATVGSTLGQFVDRVKADVTTAEPVPTTGPVVGNTR